MGEAACASQNNRGRRNCFLLSKSCGQGAVRCPDLVTCCSLILAEEWSVTCCKLTKRPLVLRLVHIRLRTCYLLVPARIKTCLFLLLQRDSVIEPWFDCECLCFGVLISLTSRLVAELRAVVGLSPGIQLTIF